MLSQLVGLQMKSYVNQLMNRARSQKNPAVRVALVLVIIYAFGMLAFTMGAQAYALCRPLHEKGLDPLYFMVSSLTGILLITVLTITTAKSQIFEAKDNELLLSLPIPPRNILLARLLSLTIFNWIYALLFVGPALVVRFLLLGFDAGLLLRWIVAFLMLPLLPEALGCFFAWVISRIERRVRSKSIFTTALAVVLLGGYLAMSYRMASGIELLMTDGSRVQALLSGVVPLYLYGSGTAGSLLHLALFVVLSLAVLGLMVWLLSRSFLNAALSSGTVQRRRSGNVKDWRARSIQSTLIRKEWKRFTSSSAYMLNGGLGLVFLPVLSVVLAVQRGTLGMLLDLLPEGTSLTLPFSLVLSLVSAMVMISAPSLSLEGRNLWVLRSLPIKSSELLLAKGRAHYLLTLPFSLLASLIAAFALPFDPAALPVLFLQPALFSVLTGFAGIGMNVLFPRLDWTSEIQVIKQSVSVLLSMLAGVAFAALPVLVYIGLLNGAMDLSLFAYLWMGVELLFILGIRAWLTRGGARRLDGLAA